MGLTRPMLAGCVVLFCAAQPVHAEYVALKSGQRLHVTSYQLLGDKYRLQIPGGFVEVAVDEILSIDPEDQFATVPPPPPPVAPYREIVKAAAARYGIEEELINSVIAAESNFDPNAVSKKNARGLMQLLPETAARFGVHNILDPRENIEAGTHYLSDLLKQYNNDLALALAAYNAGPEKVAQFGRVPPYPETVSYVRRVKKSYEKNKSGQTAPAAAPGSSKEKAASLAPQAAQSAEKPASVTEPPPASLPH